MRLLLLRGAYAGFTHYLHGKFWAGGLCYSYRSKNENELLTKFIFYFLKMQQQNIMDTLVAQGSISTINKSDCDQIKIPIPPLKVQNEVVEILDKFYALVNDISQGLPAEMALRKKQYEHYREKLLSFKEKA